MKNTSVSIKNDFLMILYDEKNDSYSYKLYHVLDVSDINGSKMVNIQFTDIDGSLHRITLTKDSFIDLILSNVLVPLQ